MQETRKRQNDNWARCSKCGHKLFRLVQYNPVSLQITINSQQSEEDNSDTIIEIKCHSCKTINRITL